MREKKNISHRPKDQGHIFFYTPINTLLTCCEQTHTQQKKKERQRKMAMKNCFQVSSVYSTRAGVVQCYQPFSSVKKIHLPISNGLNKSNFSFTSSCSSLSLPLGSRSRNSLILCKAREAVNEVQVVTDSSWENLVISSENPVLVEFWAPWCGPCRMIAPAIGEIAKRIRRKKLPVSSSTPMIPPTLQLSMELEAFQLCSSSRMERRRRASLVLFPNLLCPLL
ncbi:hypothetical protein CICLE_v10002404mg [Citrus x clementina]|uniref:Thioredoxin domain-containing protein n=1 Tax=Citrus clementina TaxID=85681 RepID=V4T7X6_CITCL|nr:hypothetical protein CICLE_v10002404mg [Citrus x clementina]